ncbi:hypothetical protein [Nocardia concava]|uniref:hypothetical protein n=1 Tax=Nocardia concava TaxID=257281 RepID=UPI000300AD03|nr:hypothetical protein [Nocardia concava]
MTTSDPSETAEELLEAIFRLYDAVVMPDGEWPGHIPTRAEIFQKATSIGLSAEMRKAERRLGDFLEQHADELAENPKWSDHYNKYSLHLNDPTDTIRCSCLADAFTYAAEHLAATTETGAPDRRLRVEMYRLGTNEPFLKISNTHAAAIMQLRSAAGEFLAATALVLCRRRIQPDTTAEASRVESPAASVTDLRELMRHNPTETLAVQWAIAECTGKNPNPWSLAMRAAGADLGAVHLLARLPGLIDIARTPRHPDARTQRSVLQQLVTQLAQGRTLDKDRSVVAYRGTHSELDQAAQIQHLIHQAQTSAPDTAAQEPCGPNELPPPEEAAPDLTAGPEADL